MAFIDVNYASGQAQGIDGVTIQSDAEGKIHVNSGKGLEATATNLSVKLDPSVLEFNGTTDSVKIKNLAIVEDLIGTGAVTKLKLGSDFFDNSTIDRNADNEIQIKDGGVTAVKLNADVVDDTTVELDATDNFIQVKDKGITLAKLDDDGVTDKQVIMYDTTDSEWKYKNIYTKVAGVLDATDTDHKTYTFTNDLIGGTADITIDIYCSDGVRYVKEQDITGNVLTVVFDAEVTDYATAKVCAFIYEI